MQRSPDETIAQIERGASMRTALDLPAFQEAIDHLSNYHLAAMVACKPCIKSDVEALNYHHSLHHALTELVSQMQQWLVTGEQAARDLEWRREHGDND